MRVAVCIAACAAVCVALRVAVCVPVHVAVHVAALPIQTIEQRERIHLRRILNQMSRNTNIKSPLQRAFFLAGGKKNISKVSPSVILYTKCCCTFVASCMKCRAITISNRHPNVRFFLLGEKNMYRKSHLFRHFTWKILLLFRCILHEMSRNDNIKSPLQRAFFLAGDTIYVSQKSALQPFYKENVLALLSYNIKLPLQRASRLVREKKIISQPFSHSVWQMFMANVALSPHPQQDIVDMMMIYRTMQM